MTLVQFEPKSIKLGTTDIKKVYLGSTQVRPVIPKNYLCFTADTANSTVKLKKNGSPTSVTLETSTDMQTWNTYSFGSTLTLSNVGDKVYFRNTSETTTGFSKDGRNYYQFVMTGGILASGDINYLLNKNSTDTLTASYCFYCLFQSCSVLKSSPELPATTITNGCYQSMLSYTGILTLPKLPSLTLKDNCYRQMFRGCNSVKMNTSKWGAFQNEFRVPSEGTGTTATNALADMFYQTGGYFTGGPSINTTYYTSNTVV